MPAVSIIVPTYNGARKVVNLLAALREQTFTDFEVIIVIDGSQDDTAGVIRNSHFDLPALHLLEQKNRGRAGARNAGVQRATGQLLIFFDDDMRPWPPCINEHVAHHARHPHSICVGDVAEDSAHISTDFHRFRQYLGRHWLKELPLESQPLTKANLYLAAANASMPRSIFEQLGGFDERLTDAEDFELGTRSFKAGIPIYLNPKAGAWHDDLPSCRQYIHRQREYSRAHQQLRALRPELDTFPGLQPPPTGGALKKLVYLGLAQVNLVSAIDRESPWLKVLPVRWRYRLYSAVVWALARYYPEKTI